MSGNSYIAGVVVGVMIVIGAGLCACVMQALKYVAPNGEENDRKDVK